jgi:hypothetical protein
VRDEVPAWTLGRTRVLGVFDPFWDCNLIFSFECFLYMLWLHRWYDLVIMFAFYISKVRLGVLPQKKKSCHVRDLWQHLYTILMLEYLFCRNMCNISSIWILLLPPAYITLHKYGCI